MSIWTRPVDLDELNALTRNTLAEHLGIRFTEFGPDFLRATMPVDARTQQPLRGAIVSAARVPTARQPDSPPRPSIARASMSQNVQSVKATEGTPKPSSVR